MTFTQFLQILQDYFPITGLPVEALALAGAAFLCGLLLLLLFRRRVAAVRRKVTADDEAPIPVDGYPSVSVIVYSQSDGFNLRRLLVQILEQDYPSPLEVIVVNDENADTTEEVVSELQTRYRNLYMTFAPERSRNLSRKKLAVTLGMKAARYDMVALTCGNCRIESPIWLRLMMRHAIDGKEVIVGNSLPAQLPENAQADEAVEPARLSRATMFDIEWCAVRRFGAALGGRTFMGDGYNMAYARHLFFDNKGFYKTLNLNYGDDDIFISEVATADNSVLELSPDSLVLALESDPAAVRRVNRVRRLFTSRFLPRAPYMFMSLQSWLSWIFVGTAAAAVVLSLPALTVAAAVLLMLPVFCLPVMVAWRKTGRALGIPRQAFLTQPLLMLWHPFYTLRYKLRERRTRNENYTWSQKL